MAGKAGLASLLSPTVAASAGPRKPEAGDPSVRLQLPRVLLVSSVLLSRVLLAPRVLLVSSILPTRPGPALALVHGRDPGDGDGVTLGNEVGWQLLRRGELPCPQVTAAEQPEGVAHREIGWLHAFEIGPPNRERHRGAGPGPRAVGRYHGRAPGPGGVEEYLPVAVLPDERGRRQHRIQPLRPGRDGPRRRSGVRARLAWRQWHENVNALGTAGLDGPGQASRLECRAHQQGRRHRRAEASASWRIDVEHDEVRLVKVPGPHER